MTATVAATASPPCPADSDSDATIAGLPDELKGTWKDSLTGECFSFNGLASQYPDVWISDRGPGSDTEPAWFEICFVPDDGTRSCHSTAESANYEYFPAGLEWNCQAALDRRNATQDWAFTKCDPDYSYLHDTSRPRLLNVPNHQMNDTYVDSPPYYRVDG